LADISVGRRQLSAMRARGGSEKRGDHRGVAGAVQDQQERRIGTTRGPLLDTTLTTFALRLAAAG
jgi:hypothetical protein